jgi:hypothetical protein
MILRPSHLTSSIYIILYIILVYVISVGQSRMFINSKTNSRMTGKPLRVVTCGCYDDAVVVEVSGSGHYMGECSFWVEESDKLGGAGFLVNK